LLFDGLPEYPIFSPVGKIEREGPIKSMSWTSLSFGHNVLAVAASDVVKLYHSPKGSPAEMRELLTIKDSFSIIRSIAWTKSSANHARRDNQGGALLVVDRNGIQICQPWLDARGAIKYTESLDWTLSLPSYHPDVLQELVAMEQMAVAKHFLAQLARILRGWLQTDRSMHGAAPPSLLCLLLKSPYQTFASSNASSKASGHELFGGGGGGGGFGGDAILDGALTQEDAELIASYAAERGLPGVSPAGCQRMGAVAGTVAELESCDIDHHGQVALLAFRVLQATKRIESELLKELEDPYAVGKRAIKEKEEIEAHTHRISNIELSISSIAARLCDHLSREPCYQGEAAAVMQLVAHVNATSPVKDLDNPSPPPPVVQDSFDAHRVESLKVECVASLSQLLMEALLGEASDSASALAAKLGDLHVARAAYYATATRFKSERGSDSPTATPGGGVSPPLDSVPKAFLSGASLLSAFRSSSHSVLLDKVVDDDDSCIDSIQSLLIPLWANESDIKAMVDRIIKALMIDLKAKGGGPANQATEDLCALLLIVTGKKTQLKVVYSHILNNKKIADFIANDFTKPEWQEKAKKNAFRLMSQHRTILASTFFLLAGSLKDAVGVLTERTGEPYLGMLISRVMESDQSPAFREAIVTLQAQEKTLVDPRPEIGQLCAYWLGMVNPLPAPTDSSTACGDRYFRRGQV